MSEAPIISLGRRSSRLVKYCQTKAPGPEIAPTQAAQSDAFIKRALPSGFPPGNYKSNHRFGMARIFRAKGFAARFAFKATLNGKSWHLVSSSSTLTGNRKSA